MADYNSSMPVRSRSASEPVAVSATTAANSTANPIYVMLSDGTDTAPIDVTGGLKVYLGQALPAGTNNIGDVDVLTMPTTAANGAAALPGQTAVVAGWDGNNVRVLKTDSAGDLQVDVVSSALPTGAATESTLTAVKSAVELIDDAVQSTNAALGKSMTIGGQLDDTAPTAATENNVAPVRITAQRGLHVNIRGADGTEYGTSGSALYVRFPSAQAVSGTVTANQGTAAAASGRWPVYHTDGTNTQPTMDAAARAGYVRVTDGTNTQPTGDVASRGVFTRLTDGTDTALIDSSGRLAVDLAVVTATTVPVSRNGTANSETNPLFVQTVTGATSGTEVFSYDTSVNVAASSSDDHEYVVTSTKTALLKQVIASASGAMKIEVKSNVQSGGVYGTATTFVVGFTSMACPVFEWTPPNPIELADPAGTDAAKFIVTRTNREEQAMDVYSTMVVTEV